MTPELRRAAADLLEARRARDAIFGEDRAGFGEPAWDMLLHLAIEDGTVAENDLLAAAAVPPEIARRYLAWLLSRRLVGKAGDRELMQLEERAKAMLIAYLSETERR